MTAAATYTASKNVAAARPSSWFSLELSTFNSGLGAAGVDRVKARPSRAWLYLRNVIRAFREARDLFVER